MNSFFQCSHVGFRNIAVNGNDGWVCNMFCSALFHVDLTTLEMTLETILPTESECGFEQYGPIAYYKDKLIIAPINAKDILIYDLKNKTVESLCLDAWKIGTEDFLFKQIVVYNDSVWCIPTLAHSIVKINMDTYKIEYLDDWYEKIKEEIELGVRQDVFFDAYDSGNGIIWMACWQGNIVMELDMNTNQYKLHTISELQALSNVVVEENNMWLLERDFSTLSIFSKNEGLKKTEIAYPGFVSEWGFGKMYLYGEYIFLFPLFANMILRYNRTTGEVQCVKELVVRGKEPSSYKLYKKYVIRDSQRINEEEVIYYSIPESKIVKFNMRTCVAEELFANIKEEDQEYLKSKLLEKSFIEGNYEKEYLDIHSFLECIQGKYKQCQDDTRNDSSSYGEKIYQYLND